MLPTALGDSPLKWCVVEVHWSRWGHYCSVRLGREHFVQTALCSGEGGVQRKPFWEAADVASDMLVGCGLSYVIGPQDPCSYYCPNCLLPTLC